MNQKNLFKYYRNAYNKHLINYNLFLEQNNIEKESFVVLLCDDVDSQYKIHYYETSEYIVYYNDEVIYTSFKFKKALIYIIKCFVNQLQFGNIINCELCGANLDYLNQKKQEIDELKQNIINLIEKQTDLM